MTIKNTTPLENWEQEQIFKWARSNQIDIPELQLLNASLAGVRLNQGLKTKMKRQGMRKGYPDIFLPVTTHHHAGLFIELKRAKGGSVSPEQKAWLARLAEQRYLAVVAKGHREAIAIIKRYLGIDR